MHCSGAVEIQHKHTYQFQPNIGHEHLVLLVHVNDLHEGEAKAELQRIRFVDYRPFECVVLVE